MYNVLKKIIDRLPSGIIRVIDFFRSLVVHPIYYPLYFLKSHFMSRKPCIEKFQFNDYIDNTSFYIFKKWFSGSIIVVKIPKYNRHFGSIREIPFNREILKEALCDPNWSKHFPKLLSVAKDGSHEMDYVDGVNLRDVYENLLIDRVDDLNWAKFKLAIVDLLANLQQYQKIHGHLKGEWTKNNLIFDGELIMNVDIESLVTYVRSPYSGLEHAEKSLNQLLSLILNRGLTK